MGSRQTGGAVRTRLAGTAGGGGAAPPLRHEMVTRMFLNGASIGVLADLFRVSEGRIEAAIRQHVLSRARLGW